MTADHQNLDQHSDDLKVGTAYLLHFTERYEHAAHYTGWARDLDARLAAHGGCPEFRGTSVAARW